MTFKLRQTLRTRYVSGTAPATAHVHRWGNGATEHGGKVTS